ncbi:MAG: ribonuclease III [Coriobacteriaceae bacterium]|nr:MAG: ribonuclease III [Coriobacteriaceae bacterium]
MRNRDGDGRVTKRRITLSKNDTQAKIKTAEEMLGYHFKNRQLITSALTHPSAVENKPVYYSYERLEFLGDSILGAMVATDVFEKFPEMDEGQLTRLKISLVSGETLSEVSDKLGIGDMIIFGESEKGTGSRGLHSALENVYESIVGALYLDAGAEVTHTFIKKTLTPYMVAERAERPISPKSRLQEVAQHDLHCAPVYKLTDEEGPAHHPTFTSVVELQGRRIGRGVGSSKKEAETAAAKNALEYLKSEH